MNFICKFVAARLEAVHKKMWTASKGAATFQFKGKGMCPPRVLTNHGSHLATRIGFTVIGSCSRGGLDGGGMLRISLLDGGTFKERRKNIMRPDSETFCAAVAWFLSCSYETCLLGRRQMERICLVNLICWRKFHQNAGGIAALCVFMDCPPIRNLLQRRLTFSWRITGKCCEKGLKFFFFCARLCIEDCTQQLLFLRWNVKPQYVYSFFFNMESNAFSQNFCSGKVLQNRVVKFGQQNERIRRCWGRSVHEHIIEQWIMFIFWIIIIRHSHHRPMVRPRLSGCN